MKLLVLFMLILGSMSAFSAVGEDKSSTHDGIMCQEEVGKTSTSESSEGQADSAAAIEG